MFLYRFDRKILKAGKEAQKEISAYFLIDRNTLNVYHIRGLSTETINQDLDQAPVSTLRIKKQFLFPALYNLRKDGMIRLPLKDHQVCQITYQGWFYKSVRRSEIIKSIVTHVIFPSAVAFITTLLTLLLAHFFGSSGQ